jgi:hypothetical protein
VWVDSAGYYGSGGDIGIDRVFSARPGLHQTRSGYVGVGRGVRCCPTEDKVSGNDIRVDGVVRGGPRQD